MVFLSILILITNYINYKLPVVYHVSLAVHRCFFVFDGSFHKCNEQRMRVQYRTTIFRMEQIAAQKKYYDSIAVVQQQEEALKVKTEAALANSQKEVASAADSSA